MHFNKTSMGLLLVGFALLISVLHIQSANAGGKIIINNDEWTLSNTGFGNLPNDTSRFAINLAEFFAQGIGSFHAFSTHWALTGSSLNTVLTDAGHTYSM